MIHFRYWQNNGLMITEYDIVNKDLPQSFNGCTIVQISDFHNNQSNTLTNDLIKEIEKQKPNIIF